MNILAAYLAGLFTLPALGVAIGAWFVVADAWQQRTPNGHGRLRTTLAVLRFRHQMRTVRLDDNPERKP